MAISSTGASDGDERPWTYYALATLFGAFLVFLYGPMLVIYLLSFQGPEGGVTFPMVGTSISWFVNIFEPGQMANIPVSFSRSIALATVVSLVTVAISVAAGLAFRRPFPGSSVVFYAAVASLVMPSLLVGFRVQVPWARAEPLHLGPCCAAHLDAAVRFVCDVCCRQPIRSVVGRSRKRSGCKLLAAAAICDIAHPFAGHHGCGDDRIHALL